MDDFDMDEWMALSEQEADAILEREMAAYNRWWDSLPLSEQIARSRASWLKSCGSYRRLIRKMDISSFREGLRRCQIGLLKIREWRRTGVYPGSA